MWYYYRWLHDDMPLMHFPDQLAAVPDPAVNRLLRANGFVPCAGIWEPVTAPATNFIDRFTAAWRPAPPFTAVGAMKYFDVRAHAPGIILQRSIDGDDTGGRLHLAWRLFGRRIVIWTARCRKKKRMISSSSRSFRVRRRRPSTRPMAWSGPGAARPHPPAEPGCLNRIPPSGRYVKEVSAWRFCTQGRCAGYCCRQTHKPGFNTQDRCASSRGRACHVARRVHQCSP